MKNSNSDVKPSNCIAETSNPTSQPYHLLKGREAELYELKTVKGLSYDAIARQTGASKQGVIDAVKRHLATLTNKEGASVTAPTPS